MYYRHRISFLLSADLVRRLTETLLSDAPAMEKLKAAEAVAHEPLPAALQTLVEEIRTTLKTSAEVELVGKERIRLLEEQLGRSELEDERLHLSNSTLDNSLSTLKHETMYYPSRMALLLEEGEGETARHRGTGGLLPRPLPAALPAGHGATGSRTACGAHRQSG